MPPKGVRKRPAACAPTFVSPKKVARGSPAKAEAGSAQRWQAFATAPVSLATPSSSSSPGDKNSSAANSKVAPVVVTETEEEDVEQPEDDLSWAGGIAEAISSAEDFPPSLLKMLRRMLCGSLDVPPEQRHRHQGRVVEMIGHVLSSTEAKLRKAVDDLEAVIQAHNDDVAARERELKEVSDRLAESDKRVADAAALRAERETAREKASKALADAKAEEEKSLADVNLVKDRKHRLEVAEKEAYAMLKQRAASAPEEKKLLADLVAVATEVGFDAALLKAIPIALAMSPIARGAFYSHVNPQIEAEFPKHAKAVEEAIASAQARHAETAGAVQSAQAAYDATVAESEAAVRASADADSKRDEVKAAREAAQQKVRDCPPVPQKVTDELVPARARCNEFRCGPLCKFESLRAHGVNRGASDPSSQPPSGKGLVAKAVLPESSTAAAAKSIATC